MKTTSQIITSPMCEIACFEHEKVARIKAELLKEEILLPRLAERYKLLGNTTRLKLLEYITIYSIHQEIQITLQRVHQHNIFNIYLYI